MSGSNAYTSYQGFSKGMLVARKGRQCEITKIHFEMSPPSVTVLMKDNDCEVGTEFDRLQRIESWFCSMCPAQNGNELLKCHFCGIARNFKERVSVAPKAQHTEEEQQTGQVGPNSAASEASESDTSETAEPPSPQPQSAAKAEEVEDELQSQMPQNEGGNDSDRSDAEADTEAEAEAARHKQEHPPRQQWTRAHPHHRTRDPFLAFDPYKQQLRPTKRAPARSQWSRKPRRRSPARPQFPSFGWPSRSIFRGFDDW